MMVRRRRRAPEPELGPDATPEPAAEPGADSVDETPTDDESVLHFNIDHPGPDAICDTRTGFMVTGWALDPDGPVQGIIATDGERMVTFCHVYQPRPDIVEVLGDCDGRAATCGWKLEVPPYETAQRVLSISAIRADGSMQPIGELAMRHRGTRRPAGGFFSPGPDSSWENSAQRVSGWTVFPDGLPSWVEIFVDGTSCGRARVGLPTPHLDWAGPGGTLAGWDLVIDLSTVVPADASTARISAVAMLWGGERFEIGELLIQVTPARAVDDDERRDAELLRARAAQIITTARRETIRDQSRPHVLVATHHLGLGGGQLYLHEVLLGLLEREACTFEVIAPIDGVLRHELERRGVLVHIVPDYPVTSHARYESAMAQLAAWAAPRQFDAVIANTMGSFMGVDLASRLEIPAIWAIHESFPLTVFWAEAFPVGHVAPYVDERARHALGYAQAVLFEATATRELYRPHVDDQRLVTLPYGIDIAEIDNYRLAFDRDGFRQTHGIASDERVVLFIGTFEPRKAQAVLVYAMARIAELHDNFRLVLVGENGSHYAATVQDLVAEHELEHRVLLVPVTPDTYGWYAAADVFLCPSDLESLPRSILEAMAFELPVVATDVFGVPELITPHTNGYLYPSRHVGAISDTLEWIARVDDDTIATWAVNARRMLVQHHQADRYVEDYERLIRGFIRDPGATPGQVLAADPRTTSLSAAPSTQR